MPSAEAEAVADIRRQFPTPIRQIALKYNSRIMAALRDLGRTLRRDGWNVWEPRQVGGDYPEWWLSASRVPGDHHPYDDDIDAYFILNDSFTFGETSEDDRGVNFFFYVAPRRGHPEIFGVAGCRDWAPAYDPDAVERCFRGVTRKIDPEHIADLLEDY